MIIFVLVDINSLRKCSTLDLILKRKVCTAWRWPIDVVCLTSEHSPTGSWRLPWQHRRNSFLWWQSSLNNRTFNEKEYAYWSNLNLICCLFKPLSCYIVFIFFSFQQVIGNLDTKYYVCWGQHRWVRGSESLKIKF